MLRILLIALLFTVGACNNDKETPSNPSDDLQNSDQNKANDTRRDQPSDTSKHYDSGSYDDLSDSLRDRK